MEMNKNLPRYYPDIFWENPKKEAPVWSRDAGLIIKRNGNPAEASLSGWGLVDGQPVGSHFGLIVYDDVVTDKSVTPEMIIKTTKMWELSTFMTKRREDGTRPRVWYIGTRYSFADTYHVMLDRKIGKPRIYPATDNGLPDGNPVYLTPKEWENKKAETSPQVIACHCAETKILMSDWTYKNIENIEMGDIVVGFVIGKKKGLTTKLVKTKVLSLNNRQAKANEYILESGSRVLCTPDHKWWTKRGYTDSHKRYSALNKGDFHDLKSLYRIANIVKIDMNPEWQYLAGMLDGEGSFSGNRITITQSKEHNPEVYKKIHNVLQYLNIDYSMYHREAHSSHGKHSKGSSIFSINGGRHERHRILINANPAKKQKIIDSLYCYLGGKCSTVQDKVSSINYIGIQNVYNIQTESGNYIAEGYGSKNCQMLQNPLAGEEQEFKLEWIRRYEVRPETLNVAILIDPASSKKKGTSNTAMAVIGVGHGFNKYLLDGCCHKMSLSERWVMLKSLRTKWLNQPGVQTVSIGYEKYGMQADIEHFEEMMEIEDYFFKIHELNWPRDDTNAKDDRIRRLIPDHQNWRFFYPWERDPSKPNEVDTARMRKADEQKKGYLCAKPIKRRNQDGHIYNLVEWFIANEYMFFPATTSKDFLDAMSRIYDLDINPPIIYEETDLLPPAELFGS